MKNNFIGLDFLDSTPYGNRSTQSVGLVDPHLVALRRQVSNNTLTPLEYYEAALNYTYSTGVNAQLSLAFIAASTPKGRSLFMKHKDFLRHVLNSSTLNAVISSGQFAGQSVAFWLAATEMGCAILAHDNYALGSLINSNTLNAVVPYGEFAGQSVAFWLAATQMGSAILAHNNYALGLKINASSLSTKIPHGPYIGQSIELWLGASEFGSAILHALKEAHSVLQTTAAQQVSGWLTDEEFAQLEANLLEDDETDIPYSASSSDHPRDSNPKRAKLFA